MLLDVLLAVVASASVRLQPCRCCLGLATAVQHRQAMNAHSLCVPRRRFLGELVAYNARVTLAPAVFFRRILSRNDAWLASWLPLDAEFHALVIVAASSVQRCQFCPTAARSLSELRNHATREVARAVKVPVQLATETAAASTAEQCRKSGASALHCVSRAALIAALASESRVTVACARNCS